MEKTMTAEQAAIAKAEAKPGRAVEFKGRFFIRNAKTGVTYEMRKTTKEWEVINLATKKVVFTIEARHFLKRIIKSWTKATEGTDTSEKFARASSPAPAKKPAAGAAKSNGNGKAAGATAKKSPPKKNGAKAGADAPIQRPEGPFPNDHVIYQPKAGKGKYPGKVLNAGPNKVQISTQLAKGKRPQAMWVTRAELTVKKPSVAQAK